MLINSSMFDLFVEIIVWIIFLDNTIGGYQILWRKRKTFGFMLEFVFSFGRVILGVEEEIARRDRLFQSKIFMRLLTIGFWVGAIYLAFLTITIIIDIINLT